MTVTINLQCDGFDCFHSVEIREDTDTAIIQAGWGIDYSNGCHYCPECWPDVKKEIGI